MTPEDGIEFQKILPLGKKPNKLVEVYSSSKGSETNFVVFQDEIKNVLKNNHINFKINSIWDTKRLCILLIFSYEFIEKEENKQYSLEDFFIETNKFRFTLIFDETNDRYHIDQIVREGYVCDGVSCNMVLDPYYCKNYLGKIKIKIELVSEDKPQHFLSALNEHYNSYHDGNDKFNEIQFNENSLVKQITQEFKSDLITTYDLSYIGNDDFRNVTIIKVDDDDYESINELMNKVTIKCIQKMNNEKIAFLVERKNG